MESDPESSSRLKHSGSVEDQNLTFFAFQIPQHPSGEDRTDARGLDEACREACYLVSSSPGHGLACHSDFYADRYLQYM